MADRTHARAAKVVLISNVYVSDCDLEVVDDLCYYGINKSLVLHFIYT